MTTTTTTTPSTSTTHAWRERSFAAAAVKVVAFVIPVAASLIWTLVVGPLLSKPTNFGATIIWWLVVAGGALAVALIVERGARRLLPMEVLLRLALVFPDSAPSRFSMALRANSTRQLKRRVEAGVVDESATPQDAATSLLELSAALSVHDRMTRGHAERVRAYAAMIGEQLGLEPEELQKLQWAALLHDVGKLDVSSEILNKPGAPDADELLSLRAHPDRGAMYMTPLVEWLGPWALAASEHHERFDGTGYPAQLAGDEISLAARIVAVADAYDVMTSTRSYKTAMDPQVARTELLHCSSSQFDPDVVRAFLSVPISELRRPFQAALGAGAFASLAQLVDLRTVATGATAVATAVVGSVISAPEPPPAIAFSEETPAVVEVLEDSPIDIALSTTIDAETYTLDSVEGPATATIDNDILRIEPEEEANGTVTVVLTACSKDNSCDTTSIVAEVISVNDPPLATADSTSTKATQASISIPVLANDTDVDDGDLYIQSSEITAGAGRVVIVESGQELLFTPEIGSVGPWTIEYIVTDGGDGFDRGVVTILDGDLAPQARDDLATIEAGDSVEIDVLSNDEDDGGPEALRILKAKIVDPLDGNSTVTIDNAKKLNFVSDGVVGTVIIEYAIQDRMLRESSARVLVAVTPPQPIAVADSATTSEDTPVTVAVLDNDGPAFLDREAVVVTIKSSSRGTVDVSGGNITYTPPPNASGEAEIVYEVCSSPATCDTAAVRITVTPVQDVSPFAAEGEITLPSDAGPQLIPWVVVSSGQSSIPAGTRFSITTDRPGLFSATPAISSNGVLTFEPRPGVTGSAKSTITVSNASGTKQYRLTLEIR